MKIETKVRKCYLVECVIDNVDTYYKSEIVFTCRDDANALKEKMKKEAEEFLSKRIADEDENIWWRWCYDTSRIFGS